MSNADMACVSLQELALRTGEATDTLREWYALGLLPGPDLDELAVECVERVKLIQFARDRGFSPEAVAKASSEQGDLLGQYVGLIAASGPRTTYSLDDVAATAGIDRTVVARIASVVGLEEESLYEEDVQALRSIRTALAAGFPEEAIVQLARVLTDALNRVAEAESRLFHFFVHERLRQEGVLGDELVAAQQAVNDQLLNLVEPTVLYFHRKGWERALREDLMLHLAEDLAGVGEPGQLRVVVAFVDVASFTPLSEAMGDTAAAQVLERFGNLVRRAASRHGGSVVKQIGDAFMVVFPDAASAVAWALDVDARALSEPKFPALRFGAHAGAVLYRDGDYVGVNVNIAARVASEAGRHELLITDPVAEETRDLDDLDVRPLGGRQLKGPHGRDRALQRPISRRTW